MGCLGGGRVTIVVCVSKVEYYGMFPYGGRVYCWTVPRKDYYGMFWKGGEEESNYYGMPGCERGVLWTGKVLWDVSVEGGVAEETGVGPVAKVLRHIMGWRRECGGGGGAWLGLFFPL